MISVCNDCRQLTDFDSEESANEPDRVCDACLLVRRQRDASDVLGGEPSDAIGGDAADDECGSRIGSSDMEKQFAKMFGSGDSRVVVIIRESVGGSTITMTLLLPELGVADSTFEYEDTEKGRKRAREVFDTIDEKAAMEQAVLIRKGLSA